jgi:pilus assembly protein CpaF
MTKTDRERLVESVLDDVLGLGPLEALLADPSITEIMANHPKQIYVEKAGEPTLSAVTFESERQMRQVIDRIVSLVGRRVDESTPICDARLKDGSRVNVVIPPIALKGPCLTIRKFAKEKWGPADVVNRFRSSSPELMSYLQHCVRARMNILVSGGTGSGKTTLLNILSSFIPETERLITCEDAAELQLQQPHWIQLESRPPNVEGKGAVPIRELVKSCLRMRPDRIIVGECRGGEALDMLQAMNTGHDGSLTTVHANTPRDALSRIETMIAMGATNLPERAMRQQISSAIQLVVQQTRLSDGSRKITSISEITGMEGDIITMQEIFVFEKMGITQDGKVIGRFRATGVRPKCCERMKASGIHLPADMFEGVTEVR